MRDSREQGDVCCQETGWQSNSFRRDLGPGDLDFVGLLEIVSQGGGSQQNFPGFTSGMISASYWTKTKIRCQSMDQSYPGETSGGG